MNLTKPNKLSGAVIGYGFIAERGHLPAYASQRDGGLEIVAIVDTNAARRQRAAADFPNARIYEDYKTMLDRERGRIDFVDITTPPGVHAEIAMAALQRGLHVLCEKPITTSGASARELVAVARKQQRVFFPSHNYKHAPVVKAVKRVLDSGVIGTVHLATMETFRTTHAKGVAEWKPDWRRERVHSGGGIAMDHGPHTFYLAFDWLGGHPTSITAKTTTLGNYDTEDNFSCTMTFPKGIVIANLTWNAGMRKVIYTLHGSRGGIRIDDDDFELHYATGEDPSVLHRQRETISSSWQDASHVGWFVSLFEDFHRAIQNGDWVGHDAQDAVRAIELIETAYSSSAHHSIEEPLRRLRRAG